MSELAKRQDTEIDDHIDRQLHEYAAQHPDAAESVQMLLAARGPLVQLREENESLRRMLQEEQYNRARLTNRFCKAMGTWVGNWDDAVVQRLNVHRAAAGKETDDAAT